MELKVDNKQLVAILFSLIIMFVGALWTVLDKTIHDPFDELKAEVKEDVGKVEQGLADVKSDTDTLRGKHEESDKVIHDVKSDIMGLSKQMNRIEEKVLRIYYSTNGKKYGEIMRGNHGRRDRRAGTTSRTKRGI